MTFDLLAISHLSAGASVRERLVHFPADPESMVLPHRQQASHTTSGYKLPLSQWRTFSFFFIEEKNTLLKVSPLADQKVALQKNRLYSLLLIMDEHK